MKKGSDVIGQPIFDELFGRHLGVGKDVIFDPDQNRILGILAETPYEGMWKIISIIMALAAERDIAPSELLDVPGILDEIERRQWTREEARMRGERFNRDFLDNENGGIRPVFQRMVDAGDWDASRMEEVIAQIKGVTSKWFDEEFVRIYGATTS